MRYCSLSLTILICLLYRPASAQNLVPNSEFENYNACRQNLLSMAYSWDYTYFPSVTDWTSPLYNTTPDYLNDCALPGSSLQVPNNMVGYQLARSGVG